MNQLAWIQGAIVGKYSPELIEQHLNELGREGWELNFVQPFQDGGLLLFRRLVAG